MQIFKIDNFSINRIDKDGTNYNKIRDNVKNLLNEYPNYSSLPYEERLKLWDKIGLPNLHSTVKVFTYSKKDKKKLESLDADKDHFEVLAIEDRSLEIELSIAPMNDIEFTSYIYYIRDKINYSIWYNPIEVKTLKFDIDEYKTYIFQSIEGNINREEIIENEIKKYEHQRTLKNSAGFNIAFKSTIYRIPIPIYLPAAKKNLFNYPSIKEIIEGVMIAEHLTFLKELKTEPLEDIRPTDIETQENVKVMIMYELGIIDFLENRYKNMNPNILGKILETATGINRGTIKHTISEIKGQRGKNPFDDEKKLSMVTERISRLKLIKKE